MVEKEGKRDVPVHPHAGDANQAGAGGALYADVDFGKPRQTEAEFLKSQPHELRRELGLKADATSDQVYHKMAQDMIALFPKASPDLKREALQSLGITQAQLNESTVYNAMIRRDRRETGTGDGASLSDLERAVNRKTYKQMKDGTLPIDYD
jgi:hypothetical protein